jgi:hypothetical protein
MDKQTKIGFIFMIFLAVALFVSAEVSALELNPFANSKTFVPELKEDMSDFLKEDFNSKYGVIQLSKTMLWFETDRIAEYSLTENTDQCLINCESKGKAVLYTDGKLFDDKYFLNKKGIEVEIDSQYYIKENETYYEDVPQYKEVCSFVETTSNNTLKEPILKEPILKEPISQEVCNQELVGYDKVEKTREVWNEYNFETLKAGEYEWKIIGSKDISQSVDFIPVAHGKSLNEWSWYNNDWEYNALINLTADIGNFSYLYEVNYSENMQEDYDDLRFVNSAEDTEFNYTIQSSNTTSAIVRIFSQGETEIYMYYGNPLATSASSASNTHFNPIAYYYLDEASGTTAYDALGVYNGTNNGATVNQEGKIGKAYSFDGTNDGINLGSSSNFIDSYNEPFTYCSWTYRTQSITGYPDRNIVSVDSVSNNLYQSNIGVTGTNLLQVMICKRGVACDVAKSGTIAGNTWIHVCGTFDGTANANGIKLYIDGEYISGAQYTQGATSSSNDKMYIGSGSGSAYFPGMIDEVGIWDKALTPEQIYQLYTYTAPTYTIGEEEKSEGVTITLNSPADKLNISSSSINFNATIAPKDATIKNVTLYLNGEEYLDLYDTNETINYFKTLELEDGSYTWNITACWEGLSTEEYCTESETRTFIIDTTLPNITVTSGDETQPYYYSGINHTVNFTVEDNNLDSVWWRYNGTNTTISPFTSGDNESVTFPVEKDVYDFSIYANDTYGNLATEEVEWDYYVYENSVVYNPTTTEGKIEDFVFSLTTTSEITAAIFNYDGVRSSANIYSSGTSKTISIDDYEIPSIETNKNITFFLELTLTGGIKINSTSYIQSVQNLGFDDCSSNTFPLMNMSLYDEKAKTPLTGTIEVNYWIENALFTNKIATYNNTFSSTSNKRICSNVNLSGQGLYQSAIIRYSATGYVPEFYNVQRAEVDGVQYVKLYDLNESDSTEFLVTYYNDNFIKVSGAILQLLRGYINQDTYEVVEAPLTSSEGTAIVHIDTKTNLYKAIVVKDGIVLNTFNDLVFACESPLVTQCEMKLSGKVVPSTSIDAESLQDFSYEISNVNNTITLLFSIPSGVTSSVNMIMEQTDSFKTTQLCNKTVSSAGGTIECDFDDTIGESYVTLYVSKEGEPLIYKQYAIMEDSPLKFLGNNFFIVFIMLLSVVGMAFSSPEWIIINSAITLLISGALWLLNGMDFVVGIGAIMWLLVGAIILISKLAKQEDR